MVKIKKNKVTSVKKLVFKAISFFLIFDVLLIPFVTEPFIGITENYLLGVILVLLCWRYFVWLIYADLKRIKFFRFENSVPFSETYSSNDKRDYYFHLNLVIKLVAILLSALIIFGFFSIISQFDLFLNNLRTWLNQSHLIQR